MPGLLKGGELAPALHAVWNKPPSPCEDFDTEKREGLALRMPFIFHAVSIHSLPLVLITNFMFFHPPNTAAVFSAIEFRIFRAPNIT